MFLPQETTSPQNYSCAMYGNRATAVLHMHLLAKAMNEYLSSEELSLSVLQLAGHLVQTLLVLW